MLLIGVVMILSTLFTFKAVAARTSSDNLSLTFHVPEVCRIETKNIQPLPLQITETDIARGYVDLQSNKTIDLLINTEAQFTIAFEMDSLVVQGISLINSKTQSVNHNCYGDSHKQVCNGQTNIPEQLRLRFTISQNAKPGTYAWPLRTGSTTCATI